MYRYNYKDYDIATKYVDDCIAKFGENRIAKVKGFIQMNYNRGNLSFNEFLAATDYIKDKENGI